MNPNLSFVSSGIYPSFSHESCRLVGHFRALPGIVLTGTNLFLRISFLRIKRTVLALICSSVLVIAGCSSSDSETPKTDDTSNNSENPDGAGEGEEPEMPEADIDSVPDVVASVNDTDITRDSFL